MWKGLADSKKTKRISKEEIKKRLLGSMIIDKNLEFEQRSGRGTRSKKKQQN